MAASATDKFKLASNGTRPSPTTLTALKSIGASSITVGALTGWPTTTGVDFCIYTVDTSGNKVAGSQTDWSGTASGTTISNLVLRAGTDNGYAVGAIVEAGPVAAWADDVTSGMAVEHKQDGTHGAITATSVTSAGAISGTTGTFSGAITAPSITISGTATSQGWTALGQTPNTVTANSTVPGVFDMVFNAVDLTGTLSNGMKLQCARTVAAPSQCTDLESGTSQYFSRASGSITGMTFTDDFVVSAWIKLESYPAANGTTIASRYNGTSGWIFKLTTGGVLSLEGYNGGSSNISYIQSYQAIPLNTWVHVAAKLDMSAFAVTANGGTTGSYCMINGIDVAAQVSRGGTNPTALVQAGNLEIGGQNGGLQPFDGKLAQVAIYSAAVTEATILATINRSLTGSETSLVSAYSFNGVLTDLSANANTLTANNSATATNADSPFGNNGVSTTLEYAEVLNTAVSTNTTVTVRVPNGCQLPTSGGISSVLYSTQSNPYGLPYFSKVLGRAELRAETAIASATPTQVPGLSCPVYVPNGASVRITLVGNMFNSGANSNILAIWDGVVNSGTKIQASNVDFDAGSKARATSTSIIVASVSGLKTFNAGLSANTGTASLQGTTGYPANLQVELV